MFAVPEEAPMTEDQAEFIRAVAVGLPLRLTSEHLPESGNVVSIVDARAKQKMLRERSL
jgi:hypothetical protein